MNRVTQFLTDWPGMEPTAPTPTLDDLASKIAHLICPPPGPGYVAKTPQTDDELRAEIRKILDIDAMANNMPWQVPTSSSAHTVTKVSTEGLAKGLNGACADVFVELERFNDLDETLLTIKNGDALDAEIGGGDVAFVLKSPEAVRALTAALIRLQQDPNGERILETIARTPETGDDREDVHPDDDDDDDDDGEEWKAVTA